MFKPPKKKIEEEYFKDISQITFYLDKAIAGQEEPGAIVHVIKKSLNKPVFARFCEEIARGMVTHVAVQNAKTWREAAREASKGRTIYEALKREFSGPVGGELFYQIQRNAMMIRSLPEDLAQEASRYIAAEAMKGRRASIIAREIQNKFPTLSRNRARLIARTEVSKTSTAITRVRAGVLYLPWYEWRTSEDQRVRSSHAHMNHVLVRWNDPPSPELLNYQKSQGFYHAGDIYNCRCYPAPIVQPENLVWPHRVYFQGRIQTMTLSKFRQIGAYTHV